MLAVELVTAATATPSCCMVDHPKFRFLSDKPKHTWNSAVQYIDFCLENPHRMSVEHRYTTDSVDFETNPKRNKLYLSTHSDESGWAGIYLHQLPTLELKLVYNISISPFFPDSPAGGISRSLGKKLTESGWGFVNLIKIDDAIAAEKRFQQDQRLIHYIPPESRPTHTPFKIHGRLTVRFADDGMWEKHGERMVLHPSMYLYLPINGGQQQPAFIYPNPPAERRSLESCMARMLEHAESDQGVVTFKVGPGAVSIQVNSCVVQSRIGVPLLREGLAEAAAKEILLPHVDVKIFRVFLRYIYTQQLSDADLRTHPAQLLALADQYNVPDLYHAIEHYLCWVTQAYPASVDVINTLKVAETHNAEALKKACFATLFTYGRHLLADPAVEALEHRTLVEMLRDFAQRRVDHVPELPPPAAPLMRGDDGREEEEREGGGGKEKVQKRRRVSSGKGGGGGGQ